MSQSSGRKSLMEGMDASAVGQRAVTLQCDDFRGVGRGRKAILAVEAGSAKHRGLKILGDWSAWSGKQEVRLGKSVTSRLCKTLVSPQTQHLSFSKQLYLHPCQNMVVLIIEKKKNIS